MTGHYAAEAGKLFLDLDLLDARGDSRLWREHLEVPLTEIASVQRAVAARVVEGLDVRGGDARPKRATVPRDALAYQNYLRSLSYPYTSEGTNLAIGALEDSLRLDGGYAPADVEYGNRLRNRAVYTFGGPEALRRADAALRKAIALDPDLISALGTLAQLATEAGRSDEAVELLRRALAINPDQTREPLLPQLRIPVCRPARGVGARGRDGPEARSEEPEVPLSRHDVSLPGKLLPLRSRYTRSIPTTPGRWPGSARFTFAAASRRRLCRCSNAPSPSSRRVRSHAGRSPCFRTFAAIGQQA